MRLELTTSVSETVCISTTESPSLATALSDFSCFPYVIPNHSRSIWLSVTGVLYVRLICLTGLYTHAPYLS